MTTEEKFRFAKKMEGLSKREREVLGLLYLGLTNKEVGKRLFVSEKTIQTHRSHINAKLGTGSLVAIIRLGLLSGVVNVADLEEQPPGLRPAASATAA